MPINQPYIESAGPQFRKFTASAVAVQAVIINPAEEILLLFNPLRNRGWQVVSGGLEAGETILDGTLREIREEAGPDVRVRPLGTVHIESFHYDPLVRFMIGSYYLFAYQGGTIEPGDDMRGSEFRWWSISALAEEPVRFHPSTRLWILERAVDLFRLWINAPEKPLQETLA